MLKPFLTQTGFNASKAAFVPVGALTGVNLAVREGEVSKGLNAWYKGPTLVDLLGRLTHNALHDRLLFTFIYLKTSSSHRVEPSLRPCASQSRMSLKVPRVGLRFRADYAVACSR